jgi:hypothetical protein
MKEDPQYAPEHLALEAVQRIGPKAAAWVQYIRAGQPHLTPDQVAAIASRKFVTLAGLSGAVSGAAGLPGAVVDFGFLAWTQARMVIYMAAAYGADPAHPDRATDLLVLQKVHKYAESARLALGVAQGRETIGGVLAKRGPSAGAGKVIGQLSVKLARMAGMRAVKRIFAKVVPGAAIILGTWANRAATKELAGRARAHYGIPRQLPRAS